MHTEILTSNYIIIFIYIEGRCTLRTRFSDAFSIISLVFNLCFPQLSLVQYCVHTSIAESFTGPLMLL